MDWIAIGTEFIRTTNFLLWLYVIVVIIRHDAPVPRIVRILICSVIVFGMGLFAFGGLTQFGLAPEIARSINTMFTVYAAIIALAIATTDILDPPLE